MPEEKPKDAASLYNRAEKFRDFGELDAAEESLRAAIELDDSFPSAWDLLGLILQTSGKTNKARECFNKAIAKNPEWLLPLLHLGQLEYHEGNYKDAVKILKKYLRLEDEDLEALTTLVQAAFKAGDCKTVLDYTSKIIDLNENLHEVWELRGLCQAKTERYNAACISLNIAIDLNQDSLVAANSVGDICYLSENYQRAIEFYRMSIAKNWEQPEILFKLGTSLWFVDKWSAAIPFLEEYVGIEPNNPKGWNNLGVLLREKGDVKRAIECFTRALELDPDLTAAKKNKNTAKHLEVVT